MMESKSSNIIYKSQRQMSDLVNEICEIAWDHDDNGVVMDYDDFRYMIENTEYLDPILILWNVYEHCTYQK